jgi:hypothetical protein
MSLYEATEESRHNGVVSASSNVTHTGPYAIALERFPKALTGVWCPVPFDQSTIAAGHLQKQKLISYPRGKIKVIDRLGLKDASCECYEGLSADYISQFPEGKV